MKLLLALAIIATTPDYQILLGPFSAAAEVSENTPRTFIGLTNTDECDNALDYYEALVAKGVDAELDIYPAGCEDELSDALARWKGDKQKRIPSEIKGIRQPDEILRLYPEGQDSDKGLPGAEGPLYSNSKSDDVWIKGCGFIHPGGGDKAQIEIYYPEKPNGQVIILCPGGGYNQLNALACGTLGGNWLSERGFTAVVLKYRMPWGNPEIPLQDVQNVIRYCKHMGSEWGTNQVGVLGGSAGGHLAALASTLYKDDSTKPDFAILLYPLIIAAGEPKNPGCNSELFGESPSEEILERFSPNLNVTKDTPPTFIACNRHDWILECQHFTQYQKALMHNNVPSEFHAYAEGYHGWAFLSDEYCAYLDKNNQNVYMLADPEGSHYEDQMGGCREDFERSLLRFLKNLRYE